jgi:hypothetical protein
MRNNTTNQIVQLWDEPDGTLVVSLDDVDVDGNEFGTDTLRIFERGQLAKARKYAATQCTRRGQSELYEAVYHQDS